MKQSASGRTPRRLFGVLAMLVMWSSACAQPHLVLPSRGGAHWLRVVGPNVTVYSDLPRATAERMAGDLERLLSAYLQAGWHTRGTLSRHVQVVLFKRFGDYQAYDETMHLGYYEGGIFFVQWLVTYRGAGFETLTHELTHFVAFQAMPNQPRWFAEGIAQFFENVRLSDEGLVLGEPPPAYARLLDHVDPEALQLPSTSRLFVRTGDNRDPLSETRFYVASWLLVHYLMMKHGDAFGRYQEALASGASFDDAWQKAFPGWTVEEVDRRLHQYLRTGVLMPYTVPVTVTEPRLQVSTLSDAEVASLWALLHLRCPSCDARATAELRNGVDTALRLDRDNLWARALQRTVLHQGMTIAEAQSLVNAHPGDWLAWTLLASVIRGTDTSGRGLARAVQALATARELAPSEPQVLMFSAELSLAQGDVEQALRWSERAVALEPSTPRLLLRRIGLLAAAQRCELIGPLVERVDSLSNGAPDEETVRAVHDQQLRCAAR